MRHEVCAVRSGELYTLAQHMRAHAEGGASLVFCPRQKVWREASDEPRRRVW
jgi:hypothetical protein